MAISDVLFRKPEALRQAEARLVEREDTIFRLQPKERGDLAVHVQADLSRHELLRDRVALSFAMTQHLSNRNLVLIMVGFSLVLAKLFGGFDLLLKGLALIH